MKIKLSLFFTILFCLVIKEGFCTSQNIGEQTVQDTGIIHDVNDGNNIDDVNLQQVIDDNTYLNTGDMDIQVVNDGINNGLENQDLNNNNNIDNNIPQDLAITDDMSDNSTSNDMTDMTDMSNDNVIVIDGDVNYDDSLNNDMTQDNNEFVDSDIIITDQDQNTQDQNNVAAQNNTQNNNIQNNLNNQNNNNQTTNNVTNNTLNDNTNTETNESIKKIDRVYVSLMFTEENIQDIFKVLPASSTGIPDQYSLGFANKNQNEGDGSDKRTNLSIYLNSIMYISDDAWALWLNGNKITNMNKNNGDIQVLKVTPLYVDFMWKVSDLQWQVINKNNVIPKTNYVVNGDYVDLYFTLSPNQTYIPALNQILEGNQRQISDTTQGQDGNADGEGAVVNTETEELFF